MKKLSVLLLIATFILTGVSTIMAQDTDTDSHLLKISIPNIALLDIETSAASTDVELTPTHSGEAGDPLDFNNMTNDNLWLNYSSIKPSALATRVITATMDIDVPSGMTLQLTAADPSTGFGDRGTAVVAFSPSTTGQNVITGIGSCYTGDGANFGVNLEYELDMDNNNYSDLIAGDQADITVTYTMADV